MLRHTERNAAATNAIEVVATVDPAEVEVITTDAAPVEFDKPVATEEGTGERYAVSEAVVPGGIKFLGWFNIIAGIVMGFISLASFPEAGSEAASIIFFTFFLAGFSVLVGVGLLNLRPWARIMAIIGYSLNVLIGMAGLPATIIQVLVAGWILFYLFSDKVADAFDAAQPSTSVNTPEPEK